MQNLAPIHKLLLGLCLILLLVMGVQWWMLNIGPASNDLYRSYALTETDREQQPQDQWPAIIPLNVDRYEAISMRPLFTEGRKPISVVTTVIKPDLTPSTQQELELRLVGVGLSEAGSLVLVRDQAGSYHRLLVGDKLEGWSLESVDASRATFKHKEKNKVFELEKHQSVRSGKQSVPSTVPGTQKRKSAKRVMKQAQEQGSNP